MGPINATAGERQDDSNRDAARDVEPEDRAPVGHRQHGRAKQRTENAAELLHCAHHTQRRSATIRRPQVGNERQCRRHQPTSADPLQHPAAHQHRQLDGDRRDSRTDDKDRQAKEQDPLACDEIRESPDQRKDRNVPEQEARDDRRGPMQFVNSEADPGHHVRQGHDHDIGVGRSERHRHRRRCQMRPRAC